MLPGRPKGPKIEQTLKISVIRIAVGVRIRCLEGLKWFWHACLNHSHPLAAADGFGAAVCCTKSEYAMSGQAVGR